MIQLSPENVKLVGGEYLPKVCYKNASFSQHCRPAASKSAVVESNMIPQETALSPLVGLFQSLQIFTAVSQAHPLKKNLQIFDEWFKVRQLQYGAKIEKNPKKKNHCD